ncbi:hypothetical protein MSUIS_06080 [Mycoplasma suis KI3806]|uniref:Uncharacterized protein n=1 Tax=Mycoplasma suis (strain KI_3806) TaxID=708248 RepID=F0V220_MYCS3|nr:hypothetical protein [Mycoplasma suis]CBZ40701.1 hypothetical protein MSUIS_06080 [Mycoplasma suis KI3806]
MFTFSKVISLGVVLVGGSGLSAYLIPYYLSGSKNSVNETLFKSSNSSSENWANFSKEEKEILAQLKILFSELSKTLKKSIELRDLINQSMQDFMKSITSTDSLLSSLYQKSKDLIENIEKLLGEAKQQSNRKMEIEANLRRNEYSRNLMKKIGESINSLYGNLEPIVKLIEEKDKENQTSNTTSSAGGALALRRKQRKH